jgi:4'-phosphopantetheinyl transferase EntD
VTTATAQAIEAALQSLLGEGFACAVTDPQRFDTDLMPSEGGAISNAVPKRQTEFVAGRRAARRAMAALDMAPAPIPAGPDRAPIWPPGLIGSISHCEMVCIAALAPQDVAQSVGIDIEPITPLDRDLLPLVCTQTEIARIHGPEQTHHAKRVFSAKEAAFKAQYPITQSMIGFDALEVTLDLENQSFTAIFNITAGLFTKGDMLNGKTVVVAEHFLSTVTIEHLT